MMHSLATLLGPASICLNPLSQQSGENISSEFYAATANFVHTSIM